MSRTRRHAACVGLVALMTAGVLVACGGDPEPSHTFATYTPTPSPTPEETPSVRMELYEEAKRVATELVVAVTWAEDPIVGGYIPDEVYTHAADPYQTWLIEDLQANPYGDYPISAIHTDMFEYFPAYDPDNDDGDFLLALCIPPNAIEIPDTYVLHDEEEFFYLLYTFNEIQDEGLKVTKVHKRETSTCDI